MSKRSPDSHGNRELVFQGVHLLHSLITSPEKRIVPCPLSNGEMTDYEYLDVGSRLLLEMNVNFPTKQLLSLLSVKKPVLVSTAVRATKTKERESGIGWMILLCGGFDQFVNQSRLSSNYRGVSLSLSLSLSLGYKLPIINFGTPDILS